MGGLGLAGAGLFAAVALGAGATWFFLSGDNTHPVTAAVVAIEVPAEDPEMDGLEAAVLEAAADGEDAVVVEPIPQPVPVSAPVAAAVEGPEASADGEAAGSDELAANDAVEDGVETEDGAEGEDALADAAEVTEPEVVEEVPVEEAPVEVLVAGDPREALPNDLRSQSTNIRLSGLAMRESQHDTTWVYDLVVKHDPHPEVRKKAWRTVIGRWRGGVGSPAEHEAIALWVLENGTAEAQVMAVVAMARKGTDVTPLLSKLDDHRAAVRRAAVEGCAAMGKRLGQQTEVRSALEARREVETDGKTKARIENALSRL